MLQAHPVDAMSQFEPGGQPNFAVVRLCSNFTFSHTNTAFIMSALLIADSGSTKTAWCLIREGQEDLHFETRGINPFFCSENDCREILEKELDLNPEKQPVAELVFYGAGVKDEKKVEFLKGIFRDYFRTDKVEVHSDLLAAARATAGAERGVVCILGTGSNSGYFDGEVIRYKNPSLGYIVGDEGSGTFLGKKVLQYYFYNTFDDDLMGAFQQSYGSDLSEILDNIYTKPFGNRYLASFTQFLIDHRGHYMVENIIEDGMIEFHQKHILKYRESWKYPIHFCGTVAYAFKDVLMDLHGHYGLETGSILKNPARRLAEYHKGISNL